MKKSTKQSDYLETTATEVLDVFEVVSAQVADALNNDPPLKRDLSESQNTFNEIAIYSERNRIRNQRVADNYVLQKEPAIARVVVAGDKGKLQIFYVCRASPPSPRIAGAKATFVSYRAPVGRLAAVPVGESLTLPMGDIEVRERALLRPTNEGVWDSRDTVVETDDFGPLTIQSLRKLLAKERVDVGGDLLAKILADEEAAANVVQGLRRSVITKMALRDQPVLDQYQDDIFRLPLTNQLLILGPPGTGKTTTLIRRLGQKLDVDYLEDEEKALIQRMDTTGGLVHSQSWLMFTPTDLLKQYVKEAFAREGIPASEQRIATWADHRRELARGTLPVLRTNSGSGIFVLKESVETLAPSARSDLIAWFEDFDNWQRERVLLQFREASEELGSEPDREVASIGVKALESLARFDAGGLEDLVISLAAGSKGIQKRIAEMKTRTDRQINEALNLQLNRESAFLDELGTFLSSIREASDPAADDLDDPDADEEEDIAEPTTSRAAAVAEYRRFARAQARAFARKRSLGKESALGKIGNWLGDRGLSTEVRAEVGASLLIQARARRLANPVRRVLHGTAKRYREFRRLRQGEGRWYQQAGFGATDLSPLELDGVLLALLRPASYLLRRFEASASQDSHEWSTLRPLRAVRRNQVLVDEATDFSPIQLGCMAALMHPLTRSFFACGDFNQRLTTWGSRDLKQVAWAIRDISVKTVTVSYRQTKELNDLAHALARIGGSVESEVVLPERVENRGVLPVLAESKSGGAVVKWLAERIREIESFAKQLPSIAVLVSTESEVEPVAEELNSALSGVNIRVVPYLNGQAIGQENDVRVFDIQHIKGLEFEAVFFLGVDRLAERHPDLFDKYLYVGTTRAATYLGMTCEGELPKALVALRPFFGERW